MKLRNIEILAAENNKKGDLFGRLMGDLFHSLGYSEPRVNIHKSGREVDLNCYHRTEMKVAIAECKAERETIGGQDINKFVGILDAEKRKMKLDKEMKKFNVVGYFISLSGFKETAIEQELEIGNSRLILIKQDKIIEELINARILVSIESALLSVSPIVQDYVLLDNVDLVAYEKGWIWVFYLSATEGQTCTHFSLVHAEGKPLVQELANEIMEIDKQCNNLFKGLQYIGKKRAVGNDENRMKEAKEKYFDYLENELGEIQFEGLPTDKEAGSVKVQLENIFVPLHLSSISNKKGVNGEEKIDKRRGIGDVLKKKAKLAILAKPGGGKSTLLKRIAISYAFPERRKLINDSLPDRQWFPIFLRCRELGDRVTLSITEIIMGIPTRAEISWYSEGFSDLVSRALQNGNALLLIDGLDEISEDKNRILFVNQLRTFIATYPSINIIVTSREAGFRAVGGSLAAYCEHYNVSSLTNNEIEELSIKWHKAIIDISESTVKEARKLAKLIIKDNRIKVLAENPLLLTTLLFVRRWAGYLPTKKSVLYQEMIKLLLVTWNVEGHEQLDIEEAEPQLCFVAFWMSINGQQTITEDELRICLTDARVQMPEILGYTKISPNEFIKRVETRSSLLIMSGHKRLENGMLVQLYEFLHLSFQEYLTAKAIVKGFIPNKDNELKKIELIKPNINRENWKEIIPIFAVLLERDCKELVEILIYESKQIAALDRRKRRTKEEFSPGLLGNCLANEIQINPIILDEAIEWFAKSIYSVKDRVLVEIILNNKFGEAFRKKCKECFFERYDDKHAPALGSTLSDIFLYDNSSEGEQHTLDQIKLNIISNDWKTKCLGTLALMGMSFRFSGNKVRVSKDISGFEDIYLLLLCDIKSSHKQLKLAICWSIVWSIEVDLFPISLKSKYCHQLIDEWLSSDESNLRRLCAWALTKLLTPEMSDIEMLHLESVREVLYSRQKASSDNEYDPIVSTYIMIILGWEVDLDYVSRIFENHLSPVSRRVARSNVEKFANTLGIDIDSLRKNANMPLAVQSQRTKK